MYVGRKEVYLFEVDMTLTELSWLRLVAQELNSSNSYALRELLRWLIDQDPSCIGQAVLQFLESEGRIRQLNERYDGDLEQWERTSR